MTIIQPDPSVADPIPVIADPPTLGVPIVATPLAVAPLTAADGSTFIVQIMNPGNGTITPASAATWTRSSDGGLDVYDINGNLVASFPEGQWTNVQLVQAPVTSA